MEAREQLGIDTDAVLIGFGAEDLKSERKGIRHLLNALRIIETQSEIKTESKIECLLFGSGKIVDTAGLPKLHQLGYVDSPAMQALIYSAADIVIVPSREDNQPQVGLEAMACETPVIGFDAGGIPEYVRDGKTGFVAELGNEVHLAERISHLADNRDLQILMGQAGRLMMEDEFEVGCQTQKYLELYQSATRRQLSRAAA
jgi:glycosyltransferase involved in cell wall biosynthesis